MSIYDYGDRSDSLVAVPGFEVVRRIGGGGFSTVYEAIQQDVRDSVALKVLTVDVGDARGRARFERECMSMGRLRGRRGIVPVYRAAFTSDGRPVIVMAYLPGGSLADLLATSGPLPVGEVVTIGCEVAAALDLAHEEGIYHRDVKPENLLIDRDGHVAVTDFGIAFVTDLAASTQTDSILTPPHAPPERFIVNPAGEDPAAGDVYSLASTLYELLAGRPPFGSAAEGGIASLVNRVLGQPPPPLPRSDVPLRLVRALERALAKQPAERYSSAREFAADLRAGSLGTPDDEAGTQGAPVASPNTGGHGTLIRPRTPTVGAAAQAAAGQERTKPGIASAEQRRSPTRRVARRPLPVETPAETAPVKRRMGLWISAVGIAAGLALAVGGLIVRASATHGRDTATTLPAPSATVAPGVLALKPPVINSVKPSSGGHSITFSWTDPNPHVAAGGSAPFVGYRIDKDGSPGLITKMNEDASGNPLTRVTTSLRELRGGASEPIDTATGQYCVRVVFAGFGSAQGSDAPTVSGARCIEAGAVN